jgi:hypothetical protein
MHGFSVTFERYFPHDDYENICEADESGFVIENVSLRDAIHETGAYASCCDQWPVLSPSWINFDNWNDGTHEYYCTGITESRALHIPDHVTPASRRRIARLLGVKVS